MNFYGILETFTDTPAFAQSIVATFQTRKLAADYVTHMEDMEGPDAPTTYSVALIKSEFDPARFDMQKAHNWVYGNFHDSVGQWEDWDVISFIEAYHETGTETFEK